MTEEVWHQGLVKLVLHDRHNPRASRWTPLLEAMETIGDNLIKFLLGENWRTSGMFDFIGSNLVLAEMIVYCGALDTKYLADELEWNAQPVFLAQNPTCAEALLAERWCRSKSHILLQAFDDLIPGATATSSGSAHPDQIAQGTSGVKRPKGAALLGRHLSARLSRSFREKMC
jgi:hypothetical protein